MAFQMPLNRAIGIYFTERLNRSEEELTLKT